MLSKNELKAIKALQLKKNRKTEQRFVVEGRKGVLELLPSSWQVELVACTEAFAQAQDHALGQWRGRVEEVPPKVLEGMSSLQSNRECLAVVHMPKPEPLTLEPGSLVLALDNVRDPGNLGTIIRIADWYGINGIMCSPETADVFNAKVIQASMGSFIRVPVHYGLLTPFLEQAKAVFPIFGAFLEGEPVHGQGFERGGVLLMGSESHGISEALKPHVSHQVSIPRYGGAESLNVAIATAIICDVARQQQA